MVFPGDLRRSLQLLNVRQDPRLVEDRLLGLIEAEQRLESALGVGRWRTNSRPPWCGSSCVPCLGVARGRGDGAAATFGRIGQSRPGPFAAASMIFSTTASTLKLADFCRGGNSLNVDSHLATTAFAWRSMKSRAPPTNSSSTVSIRFFVSGPVSSIVCLPTTPHRFSSVGSSLAVALHLRTPRGPNSSLKRGSSGTADPRAPLRR